MSLTTWPRRLFFASVLMLTFTLATQNQDQYLAGNELEDLLLGRQWMFSKSTPDEQQLRRFKRFTDSKPSKVPTVASIIDNPNQSTQGRPPVVILDRVNPTLTKEEVLWREIARLRERNRNSPIPFNGNRSPVTVSQTRGNPVVSNPTQIRPGGIPFAQARPGGGSPITQVGGTIAIDDQSLEETFARCGQFLERCLGNNQGQSHGHHHFNHGPASNTRPVVRTQAPGRLAQFASGSFSNQNHRQHQYNPMPAFTTFNGQRIPVWPG
ncbi:uncharacterized protein [Palaemon carinicauda]|uniref:uncharacterized protein n=1 Tax=Palaemon carinicauda TaxID=392227 RepID=UPI0035B59817